MFQVQVLSSNYNIKIGLPYISLIDLWLGHNMLSEFSLLCESYVYILRGGWVVEKKGAHSVNQKKRKEKKGAHSKA